VNTAFELKKPSFSAFTNNTDWPMVERSSVWMTRGVRSVPYRGVMKNKAWWSNRAAAINLTRPQPGIDQRKRGWTLDNTAEHDHHLNAAADAGQPPTTPLRADATPFPIPMPTAQPTSQRPTPKHKTLQRLAGPAEPMSSTLKVTAPAGVPRSVLLHVQHGLGQAAVAAHRAG
jgi:hypothetical protein